MYMFNKYGQKVDMKNVNLAVSLEELKKKSGSNPWPVIEMIVEAWQDRNPTQWKSHLLYIEELRHTRKDSKYASTYDKKNGGYLRYTLDIPEKVLQMIRCLYNAEELPMTKEFFKEWAKKYPQMKVAQKI